MGAPPRTEAQNRADFAEFFEELDALGKQIRADLSDDDLRHLKRIERLGRTATAAGWATSWMGPNLVSAGLLAAGRSVRWTCVAHHISHNGYSKVPDVPPRYTRKGFAVGWRRFVDWFDVIEPGGWHAEHNRLHHSRLGENADPDLVERNLDWLRDSDMPLVAKYSLILAMASAWKWIYYAPNTLQEAFAAEARRSQQTHERVSPKDLRAWGPHHPAGRRLVGRSLLPYALWNFVVIPGAFLPLGPLASASAASNSLLAEWLTNLHTFLIITTNHAGDDMWAFEEQPSDINDFHLRQILGSVNYRTGGDLNDMMHGWLNYQIEHHVWPDLTMLQYRKVQPKLKALCERHGVPYVQESVWTRLRKTVDVMTGKADMKWARTSVS